MANRYTSFRRKMKLLSKNADRVFTKSGRNAQHDYIVNALKELGFKANYGQIVLDFLCHISSEEAQTLSRLGRAALKKNKLVLPINVVSMLRHKEDVRIMVFDKNE